MLWIYSLGIRFYYLGIHIAGLFGNEKAKKWIKGRVGWKTKLSNSKLSQPIWVHASSLGEFEQVKPLLQKIRLEQPSKNILLTFFSPSGFEYAKHEGLADMVMYLPLDTKSNARNFIDLVDASVAVFVKYDFWYNLINVLEDRSTPILFMGCNFQKQHSFFKWYGKWQIKYLQKISTILHLNENSYSNAKLISPTRHLICGDTRVDKVIDNANNKSAIPFFESFIKDSKVLILGSSWQKEEKLLKQSNFSVDRDWKLIIAPHDISESHLVSIENEFVKAVRYSNIQSTDEPRIILMDNIGMLSNLYQYADVALIGGGFTNSLHNILEPAAMNCALIYGDNCSKYPEGKALKEAGGAIQVSDSNDLSSALSFYSNETNLQTAKSAALSFIESNKGATEIVYQELQKFC